MRKVFWAFIILAASFTYVHTEAAAAYNFGDFRSETLTGKAWTALNDGDLEAVLAYTNKCIELYSEQARKMQNSLNEYPEGTILVSFMQPHSGDERIKLLKERKITSFAMELIPRISASSVHRHS